MIDYHKLLTRSYLIDVEPVLHNTDKLILLVGAVLTVAGIIFLLAGRFAPHEYGRQFWYRFARWALTIGLVEALWFVLHYEQAMYLGSRVVAFAVLLIGLLWLIPLIKYGLTQYRRDIAQWRKDQVKQKYLYR